GRANAPARGTTHRAALDPWPDHAAPRRCQRSDRSVAHHHASQAPTCMSGAEPPNASHFRPRALCKRGRRKPRRLHPCRRRGDGASRHPYRNRQRGRVVSRRIREAQAGRHCGAGRQPAVLGALRAAGSGLSRSGTAARGPRARMRRDGLGDRLGSLCRRHRRRDRHAHVRLLRAAQGSAREVRLRARARARGGERADRPHPKETPMKTERQRKPDANPLESLHECGQAVWLDFLSRRFIAEGGLRRLVEHDRLAGVTSNPTIFEKAIAGSADYDAALQEAEQQADVGVMALYERLALEDIRHAADVLRPVYDATHSQDGYVSLEVSPYLANDTEGTVTE